MTDTYSHDDTNIMYITENIPGPLDPTQESEDLIKNFNSQLLHNCQCSAQCTRNECACLLISGGENYTLICKDRANSPMWILNKKDAHLYPIFECNDLCNCSDQCGNRLVQNGPIKSLIVKVSENQSKGLGLFTNTFIPQGAFVCEYAGEVLTRSQALSRYQYNERLKKMNYIFCLNEHADGKTIQTYVDPSRFGNIGRYINHSCNPNCEIVPVRINLPIVKLAVFTVMDIMPCAEITFDYGADNVNDNLFICNTTKMTICLCNSSNCRGFMPYNPC